MTDLNDLIAEVESKYFRTATDTGANWNALFIWNRVRLAAGLSELTIDDLWNKERNEYLLKIANAYVVGDTETADRYKGYVDSLDARRIKDLL